MTSIPLVKLNNGLQMPQLGLGVWRIPPEEASSNVQSALAAGYRLIDTAAIYRNEEGVGEAIRKGGVPREELFITSKLWNADQGYDSTIKAYEASLERLDLEYLDLYLIHWPIPMYDTYVESWKAMEQLYKDGRVRAIGVSNFQPAHLERLAAECEIVPAVNQVELHPRLTQAEVRAYDAAHGIITESWSPLRGVMENVPAVLTEMATRYGKTPAQVVLRWYLQLGLVVIPRSSKPARIAENFDVFDFELSDADVAAISALHTGARLGSHPDEMDRR